MRSTRAKRESLPGAYLCLTPFVKQMVGRLDAVAEEPRGAVRSEGSKPVRMSLLRSSPCYRTIIRHKQFALAAESDQIKAYLRCLLYTSDAADDIL